MEKQEAKVADNLFYLTGKIDRLFTDRTLGAQKAFMDHVSKTVTDAKPIEAAAPENLLHAMVTYAIDFAQRSLLFWDVLRERGNIFIEHEEEGSPPLLAFQWEMVSDGRTFECPVNYALVRIIPPEGVEVDDAKRPFIIVDPRAGHGPGIGGFKKDSEVGVALRFGHPVYFVIFFPEPEPGQTVLDVASAKSKFLETVMERHPDSPKPIIYGNCQGGWASMLVAANDPDKVGPVVINGAPMSYWSGSWSGSGAENPMRYSGGLLGGSWVALLASDLGGDRFDGAHLVVNFESLNPENTFWTKYYNLWKKIDTERERFLEFERWWGGYYLMNEEEIHWIVDNLFIGNKLSRGEVKADPDTYVNLKAIRSPIVIFSSRGDNITPPQQAINWISDVYSSTAEIKANGQVIIMLLQEDVGHLGIFVSGKVVRKEHTKITRALRYIERLRPGLYVMEIKETPGKGEERYITTFKEVPLEELRQLNHLERKDEKPFQVVAQVSAMNEKAYTLFGRPLVRNMVNETTAQAGRMLHPLRAQRWLISDINPLMWPVAAMAPAVRAGRKPVSEDNPFCRLEGVWSEMIKGYLDFFRDLRDAVSESAFFQIYGSMVAMGAPEDAETGALPYEEEIHPCEPPYVKEALADIDRGGYPEAVARIMALVGLYAGPIPLHHLKRKGEFISSDEEMSGLSEDRLRQIRSEAAIMAHLEPERTLKALPLLLSKKGDRERILSLLEGWMSLEGITREQRGMLNRIGDLLHRSISSP
jgi:pimeloyl-ACP methyl ester carboxylesterase